MDSVDSLGGGRDAAPAGPAPVTAGPAPATGRRARLAGATASRPYGRWRPTPFFVCGGLFLIGVTLTAWSLPVCCDLGQHAAVVERLRANLLHPAHPMAALPGAGSPYYSPYTVLQGLFARVSGTTGWEVVRLAVPVNLLVLLLGLNACVKRFGRSPWAPVLALVLMTTLWGTTAFSWSGFTGLLSLVSRAGYPSTFAVGATLYAWALAARLTEPGRERPAGLAARAGLGLLLGALLLVHPISAVAAVAGVAVLLVSRWRGDRREAVRGEAVRREAVRREAVRGEAARRESVRWAAVRGEAARREAVRWAAVPLAALAAGLLWPYFHVFSLGSSSDLLDATHRALYTDLVGRLWLVALLGVPVLALRLRRDVRDPLAWMCLVFAGIALYGWVSGHYTYGRILGLAVLPAQVAVAVEVTAPRPWRGLRTLLGGATALAVCLGFLFAQSGAVLPAALVPEATPRPPRWPSYAWAASTVRPGEPVLTRSRTATRSLPGFGADMVAPVWSDPALPERERAERWRAVHRYLSGGASAAQRAATVRRYDVRWLLLTRWDRLPPEAKVMDFDPRTGEILARLPEREGRR